MKNKIKNIKSNRTITHLLLMMFLSLILISCSEDVTPSLWVEKPKGETPEITTLSPDDKGLAGVTEITITGQNFSSTKEHNIVYFNSAPGEILEASETQLLVRAPNLIADTVNVKIAVHGVELFSNNYSYKLVAAVSEHYPFKSFEQPYALTTDKTGNIYFSFVSGNVGAGIKKLSPSGEVTDFAPKGGETFYNGIKYGADGKIYGVRNVRAIFQITEGEKPAVFKALDNGISLADLDFDKNNNLWTGGKGGKIYSITPDKVSKSFAFEQTVTSVRVYNDYLYVTAENGNEEAVWRFKINSADDLGAAEKVFDYSSRYDASINSMTAITFAADGTMFIGTDGDQTILKVDSNGNSTEWYPGLMEGPVLNMAWGNGSILYYSRGLTTNSNQEIVFSQQIIRVDMEMNGAPYHGRD